MEFDIMNPAPGASFDKEGAIIEKLAETTTVENKVPVTVESSTEPAVPPVEAVETPASTFNWEEKTGDRFKSWEEIEAKIKEEPVAPELTFANDEAKKIFDYLKDGKVDDVLQVYNEQKRLSNLDKMLPDDVIKMAMEYKNLGLDTSEINEEFESRYSLEKPEVPMEDDYLDDEAYQMAKKQYDKQLSKYEKDIKALERKKKIDAAEAKEMLLSLKKDIILPDISPAVVENKIDPAEEARALAEHKKYRDEYLSLLEKTSSEFTGINFKINDEGVDFEGSFPIDAVELSQLKKDLAEKDVANDVFLSRYLKGDDTIDVKLLVEDIYYLKNRDKITSNIVKQAIAKERLKMIEGTKNVNLNGESREAFIPSTEAKLEEFANKFFNV